MAARDPKASTTGKVPPETLELRARPQPVTRINRKILIGGAAVILLVISGIVLVALKPPHLRIANSQELFNVEHKPISDGLSKLPASYDVVAPDRKADTVKVAPPLDPGVPHLVEASGDPVDEAERVERARLARMAGQAREAQVFFRLQLKAALHQPVAQSPESAASSSAKTAEGDLTTPMVLR